MPRALGCPDAWRKPACLEPVSLAEILRRAARRCPPSARAGRWLCFPTCKNGDLVVTLCRGRLSALSFHRLLKGEDNVCLWVLWKGFIPSIAPGPVAKEMGHCQSSLPYDLLRLLSQDIKLVYIFSYS